MEIRKKLNPNRKIMTETDIIIPKIEENANEVYNIDNFDNPD